MLTGLPRVAEAVWSGRTELGPSAQLRHGACGGFCAHSGPHAGHTTPGFRPTPSCLTGQLLGDHIRELPPLVVDGDVAHFGWWARFLWRAEAQVVEDLVDGELVGETSSGTSATCVAPRCGSWPISLSPWPR